jgi:hypothetical protein
MPARTIAGISLQPAVCFLARGVEAGGYFLVFQTIDSQQHNLASLHQAN